MNKPAFTTSSSAGHTPMSEEFDGAKWTLPPFLPVLLAAVVILVIVAAYTYRSSAPIITGRILGVYPMEQPDHSGVLVAVQLELQNRTSAMLIVRGIKVQAQPAGKAALEDRGAPASDLVRYMSSFPELADHKMAGFDDGVRIAPNSIQQGMTVVAFPLSPDAFDHRQSLRVLVELYDHQTLILQQQP
jgi:hypothetical protein